MIRIVSINTWQGRGPYRARMAALAEQLVELRPDIIAMQEALVATDGSANTTAMVASLLGMHAIFHPQRQAEEAIEGRDTPLMWGLAILSRWPIADVHVVQTPPDPDDGDRPALLGAVQSPWGAIRVVCLHLTHMRNPLIRERQLQAVAAAGGHGFRMSQNRNGRTRMNLRCSRVRATPYGLAASIATGDPDV